MDFRSSESIPGHLVQVGFLVLRLQPRHRHDRRRCERALRTTTRVQMEPIVGNRRRRARSATEGATPEAEASSDHPPARAHQQSQKDPPAHTATASSLARRDLPASQDALLMAQEVMG